jgi:hypothetical protein
MGLLISLQDVFGDFVLLIQSYGWMVVNESEIDITVDFVCHALPKVSIVLPDWYFYYLRSYHFILPKLYCPQNASSVPWLQ